jgi:hypothetical protein
LHPGRLHILPLLLSFLVLAGLLYLMGWAPKGDAGMVARFVRKYAVALFAGGILLILTHNPLVAVIGAAVLYPLLQNTDWIPQPRPRASSMTVEEAYSVLGLAPGATADDVKMAHRNLMMRSHPDQGGTAYLAAKVNEAKEVLLKNIKS